MKVVINYKSPPTLEKSGMLCNWFPYMIKESFPLLFLGFRNLSTSWYVCLLDLVSTTKRVNKAKTKKNSWFQNKITVFPLFKSKTQQNAMKALDGVLEFQLSVKFSVISQL